MISISVSISFSVMSAVNEKQDTGSPFGYCRRAYRQGIESLALQFFCLPDGIFACSNHHRHDVADGRTVISFLGQCFFQFPADLQQMLPFAPEISEVFQYPCGPLDIDRRKGRCEDKGTHLIDQIFPDGLSADDICASGCCRLPESSYQKVDVVDAVLFFGTS